MEAVLATVSLALYYTGLVNAIPPPQCNANFRWDDCGRPPEPVMYYWKLGSRCEVGIWKGCLPNVNMFRDEYECVSTCIFSVRAQPGDWHNLQVVEETTMDYETTQTTDTVAETDNVTNGPGGGDGGGGDGGGEGGGGDDAGKKDDDGGGGEGGDAPAEGGEEGAEPAEGGEDEAPPEE